MAHESVLSCLSYVQLYVNPWTVPTRILCPWNFPGKNTGVGRHLLSLGHLPDPGVEPESLVSPTLAGGFFTTAPRGEPHSLAPRP